MKDNATTRRKTDDADDREFSEFMAALFGGSPADEGMADVQAIMEKIDDYLGEHYGKGADEGEIDVRAHLIESELTVKTPPDVKTVAALRALADALDWAIVQVRGVQDNTTQTAAAHAD